MTIGAKHLSAVDNRYFSLFYEFSQMGHCDFSDGVYFVSFDWSDLYCLLLLASLSTVDMLPTSTKARCSLC